MNGTKIRVWRALATAAVAAALLPGGVALSNYSGPYAKTKVIRPPYNFVDSGGNASCLTAHSCGFDGTGRIEDGFMHSEAFVQSPAFGLAPGALSSASGLATMRLVDRFQAGTSDNALYRFFVRIDDVAQENPVASLGTYGYSWVNFSVRPSGCTCGGFGYLDLYPGGPASAVVDVVVNGAFRGDVNITMSLVSTSTLGVGAGRVQRSATIRVPKIARIW